MPRRRPGVLLPLEVRILDAGMRLERGDPAGFHGFLLASELSEDDGLTAHGTLYKALARLTAAGLLESEWEAAELAVTAGRPRRRLYRVTGAGASALAAVRAEAPAPSRIPAIRPVGGLA